MYHLGDRSCYDESKRLGETICYLFKNNENKKVKLYVRLIITEII